LHLKRKRLHHASLVLFIPAFINKLYLWAQIDYVISFSIAAVAERLIHCTG